MTGLLIRNCTVEGQSVDVRLRDGVIADIGAALDLDGDAVLAGHGGALIRGLHDHHLHLLALAAGLSSLACGPDDVGDAEAFARAMRSSAESGPVRGIGYHESVAGRLDRQALDELVSDVAVRVQHRSGALWFLNSVALAAHGLLDSPDPAVERDETGRSTGRIIRGDHLLRRAGTPRPDLTDVGRLLAARGVTGVTDATPRLDVTSVIGLHEAQDGGELPQRMLLLGAPLEAAQAAGVPWKVVVDELTGLDPIGLAEEIRAAHAAGRPVALHCTSRAETVLAVSALSDAGPRRGDRLEHAGILPRDLDDYLVRRQVTVVTQPHFIADRGDDYLADVEPGDHELLYRCGSLVDAGVPVAAGTDAPYGRPDPWHAIAAAVARHTRTGRPLGPDECLPSRRALDLFLGSPLDPGGPPRAVTTGAPADLCLLDGSLDDVLADPRSDHVDATVVGGRVVYESSRR